VSSDHERVSRLARLRKIRERHREVRRAAGADHGGDRPRLQQIIEYRGGKRYTTNRRAIALLGQDLA
jgi:hypothetical protein